MHRKLGLAVILCLILSLLSGCGTPPAPEPAEGAELPDLVSSRAERWSTAEDMETGYSLPGLNEQNASGLGQEPTAITWPSELPSGPAPSSDEAQTGTGPLDEPAGTVPPPETDPASEPQTQPGDAPDSSPEDLPDSPTEPTAEASPLELLLTNATADLDGTWSVYVKHLDTGETVCIHDEPMVAASLIKLYVAGAYYVTDQRAANQTWCAKTDVMISASSNDACNALIDRLGMETINNFIRSCHDPDSRLNRKMLEKTDRENYITARACGVILEQIADGSYVSAAASERLLQNLKDQQRTGKIPAGVPQGVETANKTGELLDVENDACIVWSPGGTYILCILSNDLPNVFAAREEIVRLSSLVYEYFNASEGG